MPTYYDITVDGYVSNYRLLTHNVGNVSCKDPLEDLLFYRNLSLIYLKLLFLRFISLISLLKFILLIV